MQVKGADMARLSVDELILDPPAYGQVRAERRAEAMAWRQARRVRLGDLVLLEFESAETLAYQAQEMLYVERVTDPDLAAAEIAVYERLLPQPRLATATMMLELADDTQVRAELGRLDGLHNAVRLEVGGTRVPARDIPPPDEGPAGHTVTVHFLGFDLPADAGELFGEADAARLVLDHPAYQADAVLGADLLRLLAHDCTAAALGAG
ncbi:MAG TPA: DUF3501 family protein [Mycobacteriales bacterium]